MALSTNPQALTRKMRLEPRSAVVDPRLKPQSVTQEFFEEGERQEATGWKNQPLEYADYDDTLVATTLGSTDTQSFKAVVPPSRRKKWGAPVATVCAFLLSGAAFTMAWRMYQSRQPAVGQSTAAVSAPSTAGAGYQVVPVPTAPAVALPDPSTEEPAATSTVVAQPSTVPAVPPRAQIAADRGVGSSRIPAARPVAAARPLEVAQPEVVAERSRPVPAALPQENAALPTAALAGDSVDQRQPVSVAAAGKNGAPIIDDAPARELEAHNDSAPRSREQAPLRGMVWSPSEQRLVPARAASEEAVGTESPTN